MTPTTPSWCSIADWDPSLDVVAVGRCLGLKDAPWAAVVRDVPSLVIAHSWFMARSVAVLRRLGLPV